MENDRLKSQYLVQLGATEAPRNIAVLQENNLNGNLKDLEDLEEQET